MNINGFADLRLNNQAGANNESFWPSFTDIMTVIVMIFLIAMVILLSRNMELVKQLQQTIVAEQSANQLAKLTGEENDNLATSLTEKEQELALLRFNVQQLQQLKIQQKFQLNALNRSQQQQQSRITQLTLLSTVLQQKLTKTQSQQLQDQQKRQHLQETITTQQNQIAQLTTKESLASSELASFKADYQAQQTALESSQQQQQALNKQLVASQGDYIQLENKYKKLIRPARSSNGRYVVTVRYHKKNNRLIIQYKTQDNKKYQKISVKKLDANLKQLVITHKKGLYVRVIIPKKSGLSYNEAFSLTQHVHHDYDYYFKK